MSVRPSKADAVFDRTVRGHLRRVCHCAFLADEPAGFYPSPGVGELFYGPCLLNEKVRLIFRGVFERNSKF